MPVRARIDPIAKDVSIIVNEMLSPTAQSKAFADFARQEIADADDANRRILGRLPPKTVTVDGRPGASLDSVKPNGVIIAEWELSVDVLAWIAQKLIERSPVNSGRYKKSHTLFADGVETAVGEVLPGAEEYVFLNPVPYARKLEIGKTKGGRDFLVSVPNRIYERTAKDAKARFGNIVNIRFSYRAPESGSILAYVPIGRHVVRTEKGRFVGGHSQGNQAAADHERSLRLPAIIVTMRTR